VKRSGFKRKIPERRAPTVIEYTPRPRDPARPVAALLVTRPVPKEVRFESAAWGRAVAKLVCVRCGRGTEWSHEAQSQAAHRNEGKGMGRKVDDSLQAALCSSCHAEIDQGKDMTNEQRRAEIDRAIVLTVRELARRGQLIVKEKT
jgi:hypothetical protein